VIFGNILHVDALANCTNGACRWFDLGPLGSFQPAELVKFGLLIYMARFIAAKMKEGTLSDWSDSILPIIALTGLAAFFVVVMQKDLGTGLSLLAIVASMLMVAGIDRKVGIRLLAALLIAGVLMVVTAPHRVARVLTFLEGDTATLQNADADGYHISQAKIALGSGGLLGVGIGNSVNATGYLPEAINDSVFAIIGEVFGFIGATLLIMLFVALVVRLLHISERLNDPWMKMLVIGVFGWLSAHMILNIASMIGIFPLTGITLPLLSFGGTSMVFIAAAIGLVLQASRYTRYSIITKETTRETIRSGRRVGRTRYAG
jgi:cell division protein FtsW